MRVAVFSDWWEPNFIGGAERSALGVAKAMQDAGFDVKVFTLRAKQMQNPTYSNLDVEYVKHLSIRRRPKSNLMFKLLDKLRLFLDPITSLLVSHTILKYCPDVVVLHQIERVGYKLPLTLRKLNKRMIIVRVFHDLSDICLLRTRYRNGENCEATCFLCKFKAKRYMNASTSYDLAISNSEYTQSKLDLEGMNAQITQIGYLIDSFGANSGELRSNSANKDGLGYVGRIHRSKGLELLIEVASITRQEVYIVGTGSPIYLLRLKTLAKKLSVKVNFLGYSTNPYSALVDKVNLIVIPSKWEEPFGRVPLEAVSNGFKVVISESGGLVEAARFISPTPRLFNPFDKYSLIKAITQSLSDKSPKLNINEIKQKGISNMLINYLDSRDNLAKD